MNSDLPTWFNSVDRLQSVATGAVVFYAMIVALTRILGKRTTGQMNNFDWLVTVSIGSLAASGILLKDVSIADAALAIVILSALQWISTYLAHRFEHFSRWMKSNPRMLLHKGEFQEEAMRKERVTRSEVHSVLRRQGYLSPDDANWVILENDGAMTVIPRQDADVSDAELLEDVDCGSAKQNS